MHNLKVTYFADIAFHVMITNVAGVTISFTVTKSQTVKYQDTYAEVVICFVFYLFLANKAE